MKANVHTVEPKLAATLNRLLGAANASNATFPEPGADGNATQLTRGGSSSLTIVAQARGKYLKEIATAVVHTAASLLPSSAYVRLQDVPFGCIHGVAPTRHAPLRC
jgi:hypothetical protein